MDARASTPTDGWTPFRPTQVDLDRIADEVASIVEIQEEFLRRASELHVRDRVAHQYQIVGSPVELRIGEGLPSPLEGTGLFEPGSTHRGVGRISTGLGCPHLETDPDFLGLMLAFQTASGRRIDFLAINDPAAPMDDHLGFVQLLAATGDSAGVDPPFGSLGERDLIDLAATQARFALGLVKRLGLGPALAGLEHILHQTRRTLLAGTACQSYWSGVEEVGGTPGKFVFEPVGGEKPEGPGLRPGERHFTDDWRRRQAEGPLAFTMSWIPFADEERTPLSKLTRGWAEEGRHPVGTVTFPRIDPDTAEARRWATLTSEMGANPGHWVHDREDSVRHPATEFGAARKIAYRESQRGRGALPDEAYASVFEAGRIDEALGAELDRRRAAKALAGHVSWAPEGTG